MAQASGRHHLAALRHRRITFISGPLQLHSAKARVDVFGTAAKEARYLQEDAKVVEADHTLEGGMLAFERMQARGELPTAIMCSNDMTAIGLFDRLSRAQGLVDHRLRLHPLRPVHNASVDHRADVAD